MNEIIINFQNFFESKAQKFGVLLKLLRLPPGVADVNIKYTLKWSYKDQVHEEELEHLGYIHKFYEIWFDVFDGWRDLESMKFEVKIEVVGVHCYDEEMLFATIEKDDWHKYGIVDQL